jgi:PBP4 family serine-type D-alanyl-D-alanine carboxypeptidase
MTTDTGRGAQTFAAAVREIMERDVFSGARFGIDVRDMASGAPIFQHNAYEVLAGASTTKILTAVYALALLGPDFRFRTRLVRSGPVDESGTLRGDLILVASGDPNLSNRVTPQDTLDFENLDHSNTGEKARIVERDPLQVIKAFTRGVRDAGIRRLTGTVRVDVHLFAEGEREIGTGTIISPVAVNDNQIDIEVTAGLKAGDQLSYRAIPQSSYVRFIDRATTGEPDTEHRLHFSKERKEADDAWSVVISGSVPPGSTSMTSFAVESPSRFARTLLVEELASAGIVIEGGLFGPSTTADATSETAQIVAAHVSPPLVEATKVMLKVSQNLHAEMLIPVIGATLKGARGEEAREAGYSCCAQLLDQWKVDTTGWFQGDACGAYGHFSPDFMSRLLVHVAASPIYQPLLHGLPIMGRDGTLWDIQCGSPAAGHVTAKTGTYIFEDPLRQRVLYVAKGLAGYVTTRGGRQIAFTIYLNNLLCAKDSNLSPGQALGELATLFYEHV